MYHGYRATTLHVFQTQVRDVARKCSNKARKASFCVVTMATHGQGPQKDGKGHVTNTSRMAHESIRDIIIAKTGLHVVKQLTSPQKCCFF